MSESYPKSSTWPFILSGMLLFGMVLLPPTQWPRAVRDIYADWVEAKNNAPVQKDLNRVNSRVIIGHDPWAKQQQPSAVQLARPSAGGVVMPIAAAPTSIVTKSGAVVSPELDATSLNEPVAGIHPPVEANEVRERYVWQPPNNWVPRLIEPFSAEPLSPSQKTKPERFSRVEIADPVARLEVRVRPSRKSISVPEHRFSEFVEPIEQIEIKPEKTELVEAPDEKTEPNPRIKTPLQSHGGWQLSRRLQELLQLGAEKPRLEKWAKQLRRQVLQFSNSPITGSASQRRSVEQLAALANYPVDIRSWTPDEQRTYWRIRYAMQRRTDVWRPLLETATTEGEHAKEVQAQLRDAAEQLAGQLRSDRASEPWVTYLKLDRIAKNDHHRAAEVTLGLLRDANLDNSQKRFLSAPVFQEFESNLRASISSGTTAASFVAAMERYEDKSDAKNSKSAIAVLQRFGTGPHVDRYLSAIRAVDTHYRNANLRISVSEELLNRFMPAFHQYAEQVDDTILGAAVRGRNSTLTNLSIQLIPDPRAIRVGLLANGMVDSDTASRKGPVVVYNRGTSRFAAGKELVIDAGGIFLGQTETRASTGSRLVGLKTDLDNYPLLGWFMRNVARQQHDEQRPFLQAEVLQRVRRSASKKLDVEVQRRLANVETRVQSRVVQPLQELNLDPRALEMRTTDDRAILRSRLAGPLQFGAHTPRPQARTDSKMSFQIHQTAANNLVEQFHLHGRRMTLGELATELASRFGMEIQIAEKRRDTIVEFAKEMPLDFRFEDGQIQITIHFAELDNGDERWQNFSVRGFYRADAQQMDMELIRDGSIELVTDSMRLRDQIALRSIFTKVFATNQRLDILRRAIQDQPKLQSLSVSQLTIRDGWIAVSIGETAAGVQASSQAPSRR